VNIFGTLALLCGLAAVGGAIWTHRRIANLSKKKKKRLFKKKVNSVFVWFEGKGLLARTQAFDRDYLEKYPALKLLEDDYESVREECLALIGAKQKLTDISVMGGSYTKKGIHIIKWKSFLFKSGEFSESNCDLCPKTAAILRKIPDMDTAFFSVLDPKQYVTPHWGYYKGFLRYHLGVLIPNDNRDRNCYLRVNDDPVANSTRDETAIENGAVYYWKNGEGIVFDDNYLHDATNDSDEVRVVLWLDMRRKLPFYLRWYNAIVLRLVYSDESIQKIRTNAEVRL
jgi:aspartyl/asparaginyl beta-hydroxylase (cupin superfamily)